MVASLKTCSEVVWEGPCLSRMAPCVSLGQAQARFMSPETHTMEGGEKHGRLRRQRSGNRTWGRVRAPRGLGVCPERSLPDPVGRGGGPGEETRREEDAARTGHRPTRGDWDAGRDPDAWPVLAHAGRVEHAQVQSHPGGGE